MAGVTSPEGSRALIALIAAAAVLALGPAPALAGEKVPKPPDTTPPLDAPTSSAPPPRPEAADTSLSLRLKGERRGKVRVGKRARILGRMRPWRPGQRVTVRLERGKRTMKKKVVAVTHAKGNSGRFKVKGPRLVQPARYVATAEHSGNSMLKRARARSRKFEVEYPSLGRGDGGQEVKIFNRLLDRQGYVPSRGRRFTDRTGRAVLAYRKVHGMARITRSTPRIFKTLADGRGTYKLKHPGAGRHVEASVGRQVLVLADRGKARRIYHVSTGARGTPSDRGHFRFNRRQPGYNALRMYFTTYYNRGEGIHGYHSVPTHPASHGCIRTPISDALYIYRWVSLGMSIYVY